MWIFRCKYTGFCWELDGRLTGGTLFVPRILTFQMLKSKILSSFDFNFRLECLTLWHGVFYDNYGINNRALVV